MKLPLTMTAGHVRQATATPWRMLSPGIAHLSQACCGAKQQVLPAVALLIRCRLSLSALAIAFIWLLCGTESKFRARRES